MNWGILEEQYYQDLLEDFNNNGDKIVEFNGIRGNLSSLIESVRIVRSMAGVND